MRLRVTAWSMVMVGALALSLNTEERGVALGVMHGYALGKKGATSFNVDASNALSNDFIEYCLDNPAAKALESFEKLMK